ncbi:polyprenol phosphomannose-dependent alpha 1,6 mannosyltransferase MptB [Rhodococcus aerolatus]
MQAPAARGSRAPAGSRVSVLHGDGVEATAPPLDVTETALLRSTRRLGVLGTLLMAIGSLGAGANPVLQNPTQGVRVLGLPARLPSASLAVTVTGMVVVTACWLVVGRFARGEAPRRMTVRQLYRTLLLWALPLCVAPPMFSKDVYSYLAQSEIAARGLDPYALGPAQALGVDDVLTRTVPTIWRDTPAPYGPVFLWLGKGISSITGNAILEGIFLHRLLALAGVALIAWSLPRLARRCGVAPVPALWLGVLNPLVLFHLVSGIHNEALMLGLVLAGLEVCLVAVESSRPLTGTTALTLAAGTGLVVLSALVKLPTLIALGFVGMALARRWGGGWPAVLRAGAVLGAVAAVVGVAVSEATGLGFGWLGTLGTANAVRSWMSLSTLAGMATGRVGLLLGLGDHTSAVLTLTRLIGALVAAAVGVRMLLAVRSGRLHAVGGLGITLGAVVLLFPVVHPWYLLWAAIPLAAWASAPAFRRPAVVVSAVISVILMPNGGDQPPFVILQAVVAAVLAVLVIAAASNRAVPWLDQVRVLRSPRTAGPAGPAEHAYAGPS